MRNQLKVALLSVSLVAGVALVSVAENGIKAERSHAMFQNEIKVEGANNVRTIKVTNKDIVRIEGTNNKVTLLGSCDRIVIEGAGNIVKADAGSSLSIEGTKNRVSIGTVVGISIEGGNNQVSYKNNSKNGEKPKVKTEGVGNVVKKMQ